MQKKKILAVDPGTRFIGFAYRKRGAISATTKIMAEIWKLNGGDLNRRLEILIDLASDNMPFDLDILAIESGFVGPNRRTALALGEVRGAIKALAFQVGVGEIYEISPAEAKLAATGNGRATKEQVQAAIAMSLSHDLDPRALDLVLRSEDAADAVAVLLAAESRQRQEEILRKAEAEAKNTR